MPISLAPTKKLDPVGTCIYCGAPGIICKLTNEHVIAYSLGGNLILPDASCLDCADVTKKLEGYCGRHVFLDLRVEHDFPSYKPKDRPDKLALSETFAPEPHLADKYLVPIKEGPGMLFLAYLPPPSILLGLPCDRVVGQPVPAIWQVSRDSAQRVKKLQDAGRKGVKLYRTFDTGKFMRMLAKVAHAFAVGHFGLNGFRPMLPSIIMNEDSYPSFLIGGSTRDIPGPGIIPDVPNPGVIHQLGTETRIVGGISYLVAQIRLFAYLGTPIYTVVVGEFP